MMKPLVLLPLLLLVLLLTACSPSSTSWKEPQGVGVTQWGMTVAEFLAMHGPADCQKTACVKHEWLREEVKVMGIWHFANGKLHAVTFMFPTVQFGVVRRHAEKLYGSPHQQTFPIRTTNRGGEMLNETLRWQGPHISITLENYGQALTLANQGQLSLSLTPKGFAQYIEEKPQAQEGKKKQ